MSEYIKLPESTIRQNGLMRNFDVTKLHSLTLLKSNLARVRSYAHYGLLWATMGYYATMPMMQL